MTDSAQRKAQIKYPARVRNELSFRQLTVSESRRIASCFQRITVVGADLEGFKSPGFDDHIKLFFPDAANGPVTKPTMTAAGISWQGDIRPTARDYTPLYDTERQQLAIDFYIHDGGLASQWALNAKSGDSLIIGGPRGSLVVPEDYARQIYVCDESGMPALRRRLEALVLSGHTRGVTALISLSDAAAKDYLAHLQQYDLQWFVRSENPGATAALRQRLSELHIAAADYFIWLTGEASEVKLLAGDTEGRGHIDADLLRSVAYWHKK